MLNGDIYISLSFRSAFSVPVRGVCVCFCIEWFFFENLACHQFDIKRVAFRSRKTGFPRIDNGLVGTFLVSYYAVSLSLLLSFLPVLSRYNIMYS